jgi:RNA polymerase sigma factor (sigma-70 family)
MFRMFPSHDRDARAREFDVLLRPHLPALYRSACRFCRSSAEAEDLLQDVLVKLYARTNRLAEIPDPLPWLMKVLYREFIDRQRRRKRRPEALADATEVDTVANSDSEPTTELERIQLRTHLHAALHSLSADQRALVTLHFLDGYTLDQLTGVFDAPIGTLKSRLHRTRTRLQQLLGMEPFAQLERIED